MADTSVQPGKGTVALNYIFNAMPLQPEESLAMFPSGTVQTPFVSRLGRIGSRPDGYLVGAGNVPACCSEIHFSANSFGVRLFRLLCGGRSL